MIGLTNELPERSEKYELHRLLAAVLSNGLPRQVKQKIVDEEYGMHMEADVRGGLDIMCNLGQGIEDRALEKGRAEGLEIGRIEGEKASKLETALKMREKGMSIEVIQEITGLSPEEYMS
jgi:predicted transposase/invertase (TIGR01784 family)